MQEKIIEMRLSEIVKFERSIELASGMREIIEYLGEQRIVELDKVNIQILHCSQIHGVDHINRVIVLGSLLAARENVSENDWIILLNALKYHDIGRINDKVDDSHGLRGAELIRKLYERDFLKDEIKTKEELDILCETVRLHSINDNYLSAVRNSNPRLYRIVSLLKDADNLDRVRLSDLDPRFLRSRNAVDMISFAEQLYRNYRLQKYLNKE